jgi:hypothetical protein
LSLSSSYLQIPFVEYPIVFDLRARPRSVETRTGSKDLQMVSITLRVLTRPDAAYLPKIYRELGTAYDDRVLPVKQTKTNHLQPPRRVVAWPRSLQSFALVATFTTPY